MPIDADIGRRLAAELSSTPRGRIQSVEFTYDTQQILEETSEIPACIITPNNISFVDDAHGSKIWHRNVELSIFMVVRQKPDTEFDPWFDIMLDSFDSALTYLMDHQSVFGIQSDSRYDLERIQTHARLICGATIELNYLR